MSIHATKTDSTTRGSRCLRAAICTYQRDPHQLAGLKLLDVFLVTLGELRGNSCRAVSTQY
jgi:hypothetical protein